MNVLRVNLIAIIAVFGLIAAQPARSQTTSVIIPFASNYSFPCFGLNDWSVAGNLHMVLKTSVDENGCTQYTLSYNTSNIDIVVHTFLNDRDQVSSGRMYGDDEIALVCDESQCMVIFDLYGTLTFQASTTQGPSTTIQAYYWLHIVWNKCSNEWPLVYAVFRCY